jgi:hypothetical protein
VSLICPVTPKDYFRQWPISSSLWLHSHFIFCKIYSLGNNNTIAILLFLVTLNIAIAAWTDQRSIFLFCIAFAGIFSKGTFRFVTDVYNRNYPKVRRGQITGLLLPILARSAIIMSHFSEKMLDCSLDNYRLVLLSADISALIYVSM